MPARDPPVAKSRLQADDSRSDTYGTGRSCRSLTRAYRKHGTQAAAASDKHHCEHREGGWQGGKRLGRERGAEIEGDIDEARKGPSMVRQVRGGVRATGDQADCVDRWCVCVRVCVCGSVCGSGVCEV